MKCTTCGKPLGLERPRQSWGLNEMVTVPDGEKGHKGIEISNGLIINAKIWRNGGTGINTHLCNDCLRIGLIALKAEIGKLLGEESHESELADVTQRLGTMQLRFKNLSNDYDFMQERMRGLGKNHKRLLVLATKHCPIDHHDFEVVKRIASEDGDDYRSGFFVSVRR